MTHVTVPLHVAPLHGSVANRTQKLVDRRSSPEQLPARSGALAEDDVRDPLALRKGNQPFRRPVGFHPSDGRPEAFGQPDVLAQRVRIVGLNLARPLLRQLEWPTLLCHKLEVVNDRIVNYRLRISDQKKNAVAALKSLNYNVIAAGDSYNDTAMLQEADVGFLFRAPENVKKEFPQFKAIETYKDLYRLIKEAL